MNSTSSSDSDDTGHMIDQNTDLSALGLLEALQLLREGRVSSEGLVRACIAQREKHRHLNAYITEVPAEELIQQARYVRMKRCMEMRL